MRDRCKLSFSLPLAVARFRKTRFTRPNRRACSQARRLPAIIYILCNRCLFLQSSLIDKINKLKKGITIFDMQYYPGYQRFLSAAGIFGVGRRPTHLHYNDLTETGDRAGKVSGTQGNAVSALIED